MDGAMKLMKLKLLLSAETYIIHMYISNKHTLCIYTILHLEYLGHVIHRKVSSLPCHCGFNVYVSITMPTCGAAYWS